MISPVQQGHLRAVSAQEDGLSKWTARRDAWSVDFQDSCLGKTTPAEKERERERETERLILKLSSHYSVVIFRFICRICSKIVGGVVRRACAFGSSTILCRVHQLELSLQSCAHFCLSFWIQARNCKKKLTLSSGHLNLNKRRVSDVCPLFAFARPLHSRRFSTHAHTKCFARLLSVTLTYSLGQCLFDR